MRSPVARPISETTARVVRLMLPNDANPAGNVHGGVIMKYVDEVAGIVAHRHARRNVVTARLHRMDFLEPVFVGHALALTATIAHTGRTSMEVRVLIEAEDMDTGDTVVTGTAWLTMIALDERRRPTAVPPVIPTTPEEQALADEARARYEERQRERAGR